MINNSMKSSASWSQAKIGDILLFEYGKGLTKNKRDENGSFPVYGSNGIVGHHSNFLVKKPCLIIGRKGAAGAVHISKVPCWPIDTTYYVKLPDGLNLLFTYYLLSFLKLNSLEKSTAIPGLNRNDAYELEIYIPPLNEQVRIVLKIEELFTQLDAGLDSLNKAKLQLKQYRQSVLKAAFEGKLTEHWREKHMEELEPVSVIIEEIIQEKRKKNVDKYKDLPPINEDDLYKLPNGWNWVRIGQIIKMIGSGITPKGGKKNYLGNGVLFLRSQNIRNMKLDLSNVAYISEDLNDEMSRTHVFFGDVLLNITGASIGRVAWFNLKNIKANVNQHVCILRLIPQIPEWLTICLASSFGQKQIMSKQSGFTRQGLNYQQIKQITIPFPHYSEQNIIINEIKRYYKNSYELEKNIESNIIQIERMKQSILKNAFEGKLVPQNPNDEPAEILLERVKAEKAKLQKENKAHKKNNQKVLDV